MITPLEAGIYIACEMFDEYIDGLRLRLPNITFLDPVSQAIGEGCLIGFACARIISHNPIYDTFSWVGISGLLLILFSFYITEEYGHTWWQPTERIVA